MKPSQHLSFTAINVEEQTFNIHMKTVVTGFLFSLLFNQSTQWNGHKQRLNRCQTTSFYVKYNEQTIDAV